MEQGSEATSRVIELLTEAPLRLRGSTQGIQTTRIYLRTDIEPWSVNDILAHLRACSDVWGKSIMAMLTQDNPTQRYVSPRALMKNPIYADQDFGVALESFAETRHTLVLTLSNLDAVRWARRGTFTGTSPRGRNQTVLSYAERIVNHEQGHLDQIEALLVDLLS
jgi:hypothetical protein